MGVKLEAANSDGKKEGARAASIEIAGYAHENRWREVVGIPLRVAIGKNFEKRQSAGRNVEGRVDEDGGAAEAERLG